MLMMQQEPLSDAVRGRIINLASIAGLAGQPYASAYCQAKASIIGLTRGLAVCPGARDQGGRY